MNDQRIRDEAAALERRSATDDRWHGLKRDYTATDVICLGARSVWGTASPEPARRLWELAGNENHLAALGAVSGNQAVQIVKGGSEGDLPHWAGRSRRQQPRRAGLHRSEPLPRDST